MCDYGLLISVFLISLSVSLLLTPLARRIALRLKILAHPGGRKVHKEPVPYLGGLAIYAAFIAGLAGILWSNMPLTGVFLRQVYGIVTASTLIVAIGLWDDISGIRPFLKLLGQILAACILFYFGLRIELVQNPFTGANITIPLPLSLVLTSLWFLGLMNAMNLIDGLDGLACGITFIASCVLMFVGLYLGNYDNVFLLAILAASCLGFLRYNFYPAKIFMGDSGSMFLGMILASMALIGSQHKTATAVVLLPPLTALALPVYDTFMAVVRRLSKKKSVFKADAKHIHHRLLNLGLNQKQIVIFFYLATMYLSVFSFLFILIPKQYAFVLLMLMALGICMSIVAISFIERKLQAVIRLEERRKKHK